MTVKKENDKVRKYDWAIFAQSYFLIARLACQELLNTQNKKHSKSRNRDIPYTPADLFVAILFNVKHGIEVFIKTLSLFAYGEYREGHDIRELFIEVKQKISKLNLTPSKPVYYDAVTKEDINNSLRDLDKIETFVSYFYTLDLLKSKIGQHYKIKDTQNDFLRYPDNKAEVQVDWGTVLSSGIAEIDIKEIFQKLENLSELFNKAGNLHAVLDR